MTCEWRPTPVRGAVIDGGLMETKTAPLATASSSTAEAQRRQGNSATRQEKIRAFLVTAILLAVVVTVFAPRLHALVASIIASFSR